MTDAKHALFSSCTSAHEEAEFALTQHTLNNVVLTLSK